MGKVFPNQGDSISKLTTDYKEGYVTGSGWDYLVFF